MIDTRLTDLTSLDILDINCNCVGCRWALNFTTIDLFLIEFLDLKTQAEVDTAVALVANKLKIEPSLILENIQFHKIAQLKKAAKQRAKNRKVAK